MKIIKDSICCKKKVIEKQTGGNGDVPSIDSKPPLTDPKRFFSGSDAMFLLETFVLLNGSKYNFIGRWNIASNLIKNGSRQCLKCHNDIIKKENNINYKKVGYFDIYIQDNGVRLYELRFLKNNTDSNDFYDECESKIKSDSYKKPKEKKIEEIFAKLTNGIIHGTYLFEDIIDKCKKNTLKYKYVPLNNGALLGIGSGDYGDLQDYKHDRSTNVTPDSLRNYLNAEQLQNKKYQLVLVFAQDITYDVNAGGIFKISDSCNDNLLFVFTNGIAIFPVTDKCTYYSDFTKT